MRYSRHGIDHIREGVAAVEIASICARVLTDEHDLAGTKCDELGGLDDDVIERAAAVRSADSRNRAICAIAVAPIRDLQIRREALERTCRA